MSIGLSKQAYEAIVPAFKEHLADLYLLQVQVQNHHWNIIGPHFGSLHVLFEKFYNQIQAFIDDTAERIRIMGETAPGSLKAFLQLSNLKECENQNLSEEERLDLLQKTIESVLPPLRKKISLCGEHGDEGGADFLTGMLRELETMHWFIAAHLQ